MEGEVQLGIIVLLVLLVAGWLFINYHQLPKMDQNNAKKMEVSNSLSKMQRLWTERSYLTRMSNIEDLTGYRGSTVTNEQVLTNGQQLGRNLSNLYGQPAGDGLAAHLHDYHQTMFDLLRQARQRKDITAQYNLLQEKGKDLITFLGSVCPCLDMTKLQDLMNTHLEYLLKHVNHTIRDENVASMAAFNSYNKVTRNIASHLEECIWKHLIGPGPRYL